MQPIRLVVSCFFIGLCSTLYMVYLFIHSFDEVKICYPYSKESFEEKLRKDKRC